MKGLVLVGRSTCSVQSSRCRKLPQVLLSSFDPLRLLRPFEHVILPDAQEVMTNCLTLDRLCEAQGAACLEIAVTALLPSSVFRIVVHASIAINVSEVVYSSATVTVTDATLTPGSALSQLVICSLLWQPEQAGPLRALSELSSLASTLIQDDGLAAQLLPASELTGDGCLNATGL